MRPGEVTIGDAYDEACRALGESIVQQRLVAKELERAGLERAQMQSEIDHLREQLPSGDAD